MDSGGLEQHLVCSSDDESSDGDESLSEEEIEEEGCKETILVPKRIVSI